MTQKDAMIQDVHCTLDAIPACPSSLLNVGLYIFGWSIMNHSVNSLAIHPHSKSCCGNQQANSSSYRFEGKKNSLLVNSLLVDGVQECNISTSTLPVPFSVPRYMSSPSMPLITPNITLHCLIVWQ